jgi:hypothetical protein
MPRYHFVSNINEFSKSMLHNAALVKLDYEYKLSAAIVDALYEAVLITEMEDAVDSGAFRVRHSIRQGGEIKYQDPASPTPDVEYESQKQKGQPPIFKRPEFDPVGLVDDIELDLATVELFNDRQYALDLENGSERTGDPRLIYEQVTDRAVGHLEDAIADGITVGFGHDFT